MVAIILPLTDDADARAARGTAVAAHLVLEQACASADYPSTASQGAQAYQTAAAAPQNPNSPTSALGFSLVAPSSFGTALTGTPTTPPPSATPSTATTSSNAPTAVQATQGS